MPTKRKSIEKSGEEILAYDQEESSNLAARAIAGSDSDFGIFCMGYMTGMAKADNKFNAAPIDNSIESMIAYTCIAQAAFEVHEEYLNLKRNVVTQEANRGPEWIKSRQGHTDRLLKMGEEIVGQLEKYLKDRVDEQVKAVENTLVRIFKDKVTSDKDDKEEGEGQI